MKNIASLRLVLVSMILSGSLAIGTSVSWAIVVTNTNDLGLGSLRQAIIDANADGVPTPITFDPTVFPGTITLASQLPSLTDPGDTIDGSGNGVILDGSALVGNRDGIRVRASNITIRGLTIQNFPRDGIRIQPSGPSPSQNKSVVDVVISKNIITGNLDGLRVSGGNGPGNMVVATITNNEFIRNRDDGIVVIGSFGDPGDGGNTVKVVIDHNWIRASQGMGTGGTSSGDGIKVFGGSGSSGQGVNGGNKVTAIITNNGVKNNVDDGISVAGATSGGGSNHEIVTSIIHNKVFNNGAASSTSANGIRIRAGSSPSAILPGSGNVIIFVIANNVSVNNKDRGISIDGGTGTSQTARGTISQNRVWGHGISGIRLTGGGRRNYKYP